MKFRTAKPSALVDVNGVEGLDVIEERDGELHVGATVRQQRLLEDDAVDGWPLLREAARYVGYLETRRRGTVCGSLAFAAPWAELTAAAVALDAAIDVRSIRGANDRRTRLLPRPAQDGARAGRADRKRPLSQAGRGHGRRLPRDQRSAPRLRSTGGSSACHRRRQAELVLLRGCRHALPRRRYSGRGRRRRPPRAAGRHRSGRRTSRRQRRTGVAWRRCSRAGRSTTPGAPHDPHRGQRPCVRARCRAASDAGRLPARRPEPHRHARRLRARLLRLLQRPGRRRGDPLLPDVRRPGRRPLGGDRGRHLPARRDAFGAPAGVHGAPRAPVRLLHAGDAPDGDRVPPRPPGETDDEAIREAIVGVTCRCTGYQQIVEAIQSVAAQTGRGPRRCARDDRAASGAAKIASDTALKEAARRWLGKSINRVEDPRFLRGEGRYLDDIKLPGTWRTRRSCAARTRTRASSPSTPRRRRRCRA